MVKLPLTIEHALLGFLRERSMHAYEIHQILLRPEALGLVWHLKQSLVYVMLERLEHEGYITSTLEPQNSRPPRKILHMTPSGRAAFERCRNPARHNRPFARDLARGARRLRPLCGRHARPAQRRGLRGGVG